MIKMNASMNNSVIERDCGIEYARLDAWRKQTDLLGCTVELERRPDRRLSESVTLPVTYLRIEGPAHDVQRLYRSFELAFMSAGG